MNVYNILDEDFVENGKVMRNVRIECVKWPSMVINGSKTKGKTTFFDFFWKKTEKGLRVSKNTSTFASLLKRNTYNKHWKGGRVVDYSGLENRRAERHRGFESLPFRRERATEVARFSFMYLGEVFCPSFLVTESIHILYTGWCSSRVSACLALRHPSFS